MTSLTPGNDSAPSGQAQPRGTRARSPGIPRLLAGTADGNDSRTADRLGSAPRRAAPIGPSAVSGPAVARPRAALSYKDAAAVRTSRARRRARSAGPDT